MQSSDSNDAAHSPSIASFPIVDIGLAAVILRCSVERVYRIPESELPRSHGPGKHCLFLMDNLVAYVRTQTKKRIPHVDLTLEERLRQADFSAEKLRAKRRAG